MSKRTQEALTVLTVLALVLVIGIFAYASNDEQNFSNFVPVYIAVTTATGAWSSGSKCNFKFWQKKEQDKQ